jgi:hypothetical protein
MMTTFAPHVILDSEEQTLLALTRNFLASLSLAFRFNLFVK